MENLNYLFFEAFTRLGKLCNEVYQEEDGVSFYISEMARASDSYADEISGWIGDMEQLYRYRSVYNALAQSQDAFEKPLCEQIDLDWLEKFRCRILERTDPLAQIKLESRTLAEDPRLNPVDNREQDMEKEFRNIHDRYVNGPLVVGLMLTAVIATCLFCLFVLTKMGST